MLTLVVLLRSRVFRFSDLEDFRGHARLFLQRGCVFCSNFHSMDERDVLAAE